jgi:hypothetical protein
MQSLLNQVQMSQHAVAQHTAATAPAAKAAGKQQQQSGNAK